MATSLAKEMEVLTGFPQKYMDKVYSSLMYLITDSILDGLVNTNDHVFDFDIGIGTLSMYVDNEVVKYKFIPSNTFEDALKSSIKTYGNSLELKLEDTLVKKMTELYKDWL